MRRRHSLDLYQEEERQAISRLLVLFLLLLASACCFFTNVSCAVNKCNWNVSICCSSLCASLSRYRQDLPQAALPVFRLLTGRFWGFSPRRGDSLHRSRSNLAGRADPLLHAKFDLDRFRGGVLRPPKLKKKSNFTNIIAPKGRIPCTISIKFTKFMRVLSLHNVTKFGCFISINDKIINNLLQWWRFQPNFRRP